MTAGGLKGLLINIFLFLTVLSAMLLLAEGYFRLTYDGSKPDKIIVHIPWNESRDNVYPFEKEHGVFRILALGDSFTYGLGVKANESWPTQLEKKLNSRGAQRYEVINAGFPGVGTGRQYGYLVRTGLMYDPDIVVLSYYMNDAGKNPYILQGIIDEKMVSYSRGEKSSYLLYEIERILKRRAVLKESTEEFTKGYFDKNDRWELSKEKLVEMNEECETRGVDFIVIMYPALYELNDDYPFETVYDTVMAYNAEKGIDSFDTFPSFKGLDYPGLWVSRRDIHPNSKANDIYSSAVFNILISNNYLNKTSG